VGYEVSTPVFEGPFDLLLHLISQQQVDIHEVSLTAIVEAFVGHLERLELMDLDVTSEFLLIAAILVELKVRRLLPDRDGVDMDDELALWEERDLLLSRLLECRTFKDAAAALARLTAAAERSVPRRVGPDDRFAALVPDVLAGVNPERLRRAFLRVVTARPTPSVDLSHVAPIRVSVGDAVEELARELPGAGPISFRRLTADLGVRLDVIVHFLALLELYKQGLVDLHQACTFGELTVVWTAGADPVPAGAGVDAYDG
jgi:segregation and condensation protein A